MSDKSMIDITYDVLKSSKKPMKFADLYKEVAKQKGLSETEKADKIANYYTSLFMDKRFACLKDSRWDLTDRHKFDDTHVDVESIYNNLESETNENTDTEELDDDEKKDLGLINEEDEEDEDSSSKENQDA